MWFFDINLPLSQVFNPLLFQILNEELKNLDSYETFRTRLIPALLDQLFKDIDAVLEKDIDAVLISFYLPSCRWLEVSNHQRRVPWTCINYY